MSAYTVTAKGQITLRKELLLHLGIQAGQRVSIDKLPGGEIRIRASRPTDKISAVFGLLKRDGEPPVSIEEMNSAIASGWAGER